MSALQKLSGSFLPPRSGQAKQLVMFLHGYGANGDDLLAIGDEWAQALPDAAFVAPNAPDACEAFPIGYQWFSIRAAEGIVTKELDRAELISKPAAILNDYINTQLAHWQVAEEKLLVAGFSQGAMMAMYAMPRRKKACAGVIGWSGMLIDAEGLKKPGIVKPPVLAIHGDADEVVPPDCLAGVEQGFAAAGFDVETLMRPELGHGIDGFSLQRSLQFAHEQLEK